MKKLPITENPWIQAYHMRNFELGVMQHKTPWIYAKYINCYYNHNPKAKIIFDHCISKSGRFFSAEKAMLFQKFLFKKEIFKLDIIDFVEWAKDLLDKDWYILGYFDEYHIKAKAAYGKFHFKHSIFIYGYDDAEELFYGIGYVDDTNYKTFTFSFDEFRLALPNDFDRENEKFKPQGIDRIEFNAVKENHDYKFEFNLKEVYIGISDFLNSRNSFGEDRKGIVYGIECEREFANYILGNKNSYLDIRYSRLFMELKDIMVRRLNYLVEINALSPDIVEEYKEIAKMQATVHLLFIKYELRRKEDILARAAAIVNNIIEAELKILPKICDALLPIVEEEEKKKGEYLK